MIYLSLFDNASQPEFPDNRLSHFTNLLATPLTGSYEVALCELFLPFSFRNVTEKDAYVELLDHAPDGKDALGRATTLAGLHELLGKVGGHLVRKQKRYHVSLPSGYALLFTKVILGLPKGVHGDDLLVTIGEETKEVTSLGGPVDLVRTTTATERITLRADYYGTCQEVIDHVNEKSEKLQLSLNEKTGLVKIHSQVDSVRFSEQLANILGLRRAAISKGHAYARYAFDPFPGTSIILVYCKEVAEQFIGDTMAPILRLVPLKKTEKNEMLTYIFDVLQFRQLKVNELTSLTITLRDEVGRELSFSPRGRVGMTLALRPIS